MDAANPIATYVAIEEGKIVGVGNEEILELFPNFEIEKKFENQVILPGFIEGHAHIMAGQDGLAPYVGFFDRPSPDGTLLKGLKSVDEVILYLKECDSKLAPNEILIGTGFDPIYFDGPRVGALDLDKVSTSRMIFLLHASGHLMTVNSLVLSKLPAEKISSTVGIVKDESGKPTGELQELEAMELGFVLMGETFAKFTDPEVLIPRFIKLAQMSGCTTITDMGVDLNLDDEKQIDQLLELTKNSPVRIVPMYFVPQSKREPVDMITYIKTLETKNTDKLKFGKVKFLADGSIQGYTARLKEPYINGVKNGIWNQTPEQLKDLVRLFTAARMQVNCHCNGDEASQAFIDAVKESLEISDWKDHRHTIQHAQMVYEDQMREVKELGMCVNLFTNHIYYWGDIHVEKTIGLARAEKMDGAATALSLGVPFSLHCDANVTPISPLFNMWSAVNRLTASGKILGKAEKISVEDALYAMTMGTAYLLNMEQEIGSISVGKSADFVVLGEDPLTIDPLRLKDIQIITTIISGNPN